VDFFLGFSDIGVNSGTAVMARRTGQRDRGGAGFPSWWLLTVNNCIKVRS
jgi:hypothetical protein